MGWCTPSSYTSTQCLLCIYWPIMNIPCVGTPDGGGDHLVYRLGNYCNRVSWLSHVFTPILLYNPKYIFTLIYCICYALHVRNHLVRVHNVILIECIFGSEKPRGVGILGKGSPGATGRTKGSVYGQRGAEVDGSCLSKEGSK